MRGGVSETERSRASANLPMKGTAHVFLILTGSSEEPCEMGTKGESIYYLLLSPTDQEWPHRYELLST